MERCFNRLKQFRGLATRYAKRAAYYQARLDEQGEARHPDRDLGQSLDQG